MTSRRYTAVSPHYLHFTYAQVRLPFSLYRKRNYIHIRISIMFAKDIRNSGNCFIKFNEIHCAYVFIFWFCMILFYIILCTNLKQVPTIPAKFLDRGLF